MIALLLLPLVLFASLFSFWGRGPWMRPMGFFGFRGGYRHHGFRHHHGRR